MAEERYNYDMAAAIDALLKETDTMKDVNLEMVSSLRALARKCRAMRAAAEEFSTSGSSSSASSNSGSSISESTESFDKESEMGKSTDKPNESDESTVWNNNQRDEAYLRAVEHFVMRLRDWRMELEDARYKNIDFDAPPKVWTRKERIIMKTEMLSMSYEIRKKAVIDKINRVKKRRATKAMTQENLLALELLDLLLQDIFLHRIEPYKDVVFPVNKENIYDYERVSIALKRRHSPAECQEFWYTKFHPDVNSKSWTKAENRALAALADAYNLHHWDEIAKELNTNRSGFQCYVQFRRHLYKEKQLFVKLSQ